MVHNRMFVEHRQYGMRGRADRVIRQRKERLFHVEHLRPIKSTSEALFHVKHLASAFWFC